MFFDRIKADDPVGATSVHLVNGVFGTLCVGLFARRAIMQTVGVTTSKAPGLFFGGGTDAIDRAAQRRRRRRRPMWSSPR